MPDAAAGALDVDDFHHGIGHRDVGALLAGLLQHGLEHDVRVLDGGGEVLDGVVFVGGQRLSGELAIGHSPESGGGGSGLPKLFGQPLGCRRLPRVVGELSEQRPHLPPRRGQRIDRAARRFDGHVLEACEAVVALGAAFLIQQHQSVAQADPTTQRRLQQPALPQVG